MYGVIRPQDVPDLHQMRRHFSSAASSIPDPSSRIKFPLGSKSTRPSPAFRVGAIAGKVILEIV